MRLERQLRVIMAMLVILQVVTALAGIGLLERMTPAIGKILAENVRSAAAVETMFARLAERPVTDAAKASFSEALAIARGNVTEDAERPEIRAVETSWQAAFDGDAQAQATTVLALLRLGEINRDAMTQADADARRLGAAGRWALAFLALLGFIVSFLAVGRTRRQVLEPLSDLLATVRASRRGDVHRRCTLEQGLEITEVAEAMNGLLDDRRRTEPRVTGVIHREALPILLDGWAQPVVLVDARGAVVASNGAALRILGDRGEGILERVRAGDEALSGRELPGSELRLIALEG